MKRGPYVTDDTADTVSSEDIEAVIVSKEEFELRGEIAKRASHDSEDQRSRYGRPP